MRGVSSTSRCLLCVQRGCCAGRSVRIRYGAVAVCPHCDRGPVGLIGSLPLRKAVPPGGAS
jgi:hypothetical protein